MVKLDGVDPWVADIHQQALPFYKQKNIYIYSDMWHMTYGDGRGGGWERERGYKIKIKINTLLFL